MNKKYSENYFSSNHRFKINGVNEILKFSIKHINKNLEINNKLFSKDLIDKLLEKVYTINKYYSEFIKSNYEENLKQFLKEVEKVSHLPNFDEQLIAYMIIASEDIYNETPRVIQIICLLYYLEGYKQKFGLILEVLSGEGKTLIISFLALYLSVLGNKVDILTSSIVLAERDSKNRNRLYNKFGKSCDYCKDKNSINNENMLKCYNADIIYGDILNLIGDILRTEFLKKKGRGNRPFDYIIIDEIDNICIDNLRNNVELIDNFPGYKYLEFVYLYIYKTLKLKIDKFKSFYKENWEDQLKKEAENIIHEVSIKTRKFLRDNKKLNYDEKEKVLIPENSYEFINLRIEHWSKMAYDAMFNFQRNKNYFISKDEYYEFETIKPIDYENTGVILKNSVWSGLHQFLQIKEGLTLTEENINSSLMSYLSFCKKYKIINGITGTLGSKRTQKAINEIYHINLLKMPPFKMRMLEIYDAQTFIDKNEYENELINEIIVFSKKKKRVVLVLFEYMSQTMYMKKILTKNKIKLNLNDTKIICYYRSDEENKFLEEELKPNTIILSTNLAGRGTDIKINEEVKKNGGLHVIITFMPYNERIEAQAQGRAGRCGNKGSAVTMVLAQKDYKTLEKNRNKYEEDQYKFLINLYSPQLDLNQKYFEKFCKILQDLKNKNSNISESIISDLKERWSIFILKNNINSFMNDLIHPDLSKQVYKLYEKITTKNFNRLIKEINVDINDYKFKNPFHQMKPNLSDKMYKSAIEKSPGISIGAYYNQAYNYIINNENPSLVEKNLRILANICYKYIRQFGIYINMFKEIHKEDENYKKKSFDDLEKKKPSDDLVNQTLEKIKIMAYLLNNVENNLSKLSNIFSIKDINIKIKKKIYINDIKNKFSRNIIEYFSNFGIEFLFENEIEYLNEKRKEYNKNNNKIEIEGKEDENKIDPSKKNDKENSNLNPNNKDYRNKNNFYNDMFENEPIIGIDLGTTNSVVSIFQNNNIRVIQDEFGNKYIPSLIAFENEEKMLVGEKAKIKLKEKYNGVIYDVKRLIGRTYDDPNVQTDKLNMPFKIKQNPKTVKPIIVVKIKKINNKPLPDIFPNKPISNIGLEFPKLSQDVLLGYYSERSEIPTVEKEFTPEEISSFILKKLKEMAEAELNKRVKKAVITVPAYFNNSQRELTKIAGKLAGLEVLKIINEPAAAALAYGLDENNDNKNKKILVFDLGGGTFDVTILSLEYDDEKIFEVLSTDGDTHLGGQDFDQELFNLANQKFAYENNDCDLNGSLAGKTRVKKACENAKIILSEKEQTTIKLERVYLGEDLEITFTKEQFEKLCKPYFDKCLIIVDNALKLARLKENDINEVVLIGGSTRIPYIRNMLKNKFKNSKLCFNINPEEAVSIGAAIKGSILKKKNYVKIRDLNLFDFIPLSLGIELIGERMEIFINRNTPIPIRKTKIFSTEKDNQTSFRINIYEGEHQNIKNNHLLGKFELNNLPKLPAGKTHIKITFFVDENYILNVIAEEASNEKNKNEIIIINDGEIINKEEKEKIKKNMNKYDDFEKKINQIYLLKTRSLKKDIENFRNKIELSNDKKTKYKYHKLLCKSLETYMKIFVLEKVGNNEAYFSKFNIYLFYLVKEYGVILSYGNLVNEEMINNIRINLFTYVTALIQISKGSIFDLLEDLNINRKINDFCCIFRIEENHTQGKLLFNNKEIKKAGNCFANILQEASLHDLETQLTFIDTDSGKKIRKYVSEANSYLEKFYIQNTIDEADKLFKSAIKNNKIFDLFKLKQSLDYYNYAIQLNKIEKENEVDEIIDKYKYGYCVNRKNEILINFLDKKNENMKLKKFDDIMKNINKNPKKTAKEFIKLVLREYPFRGCKNEYNDSKIDEIFNKGKAEIKKFIKYLKYKYSPDKIDKNLNEQFNNILESMDY